MCEFKFKKLISNETDCIYTLLNSLNVMSLWVNPEKGRDHCEMNLSCFTLGNLPHRKRTFSRAHYNVNFGHGLRKNLLLLLGYAVHTPSSFRQRYRHQIGYPTNPGLGCSPERIHPKEIKTRVNRSIDNDGNRGNHIPEVLVGGVPCKGIVATGIHLDSTHQFITHRWDVEDDINEGEHDYGDGSTSPLRGYSLVLRLHRFSLYQPGRNSAAYDDRNDWKDVFE